MISDFAECSLGIRTIGGHLPARPFHCIGRDLLDNFFSVLEYSNPNSKKIVHEDRIKYGQSRVLPLRLRAMLMIYELHEMV